MKPKRVGILTAGGLAPCLSTAIGGLIERYSEIEPDVEILCYRSGFQGLLLGDSLLVTSQVRHAANRLHAFGGSPIGNSRVKLSNVSDCLKRGLIEPGQHPLEVAAARLVCDRIDVLHTIGGDDTSTAAAELAVYLRRNQHDLTVIGLPKTIDNDVYPVAQSLGAWTAAEQGSRFFENVVAEHGASPRMLIIHEIMGRNCGWLTAATANHYRKRLKQKHFLKDIGLSHESYAVHAVYIPEIAIDIAEEAARLRQVMDKHDCVNLFISEGAGVSSIIEEMKARGESVQHDAFGHVKLDSVNPGRWFGSQFAHMIAAEKTLVQKSGYFARAAPANSADRRLTKSCVDLAVDCALRRETGVVGHDEDRGGVLRAIEFERIKGGKPFATDAPWFQEMLAEIGQPVTGPPLAAH